MRRNAHALAALRLLQGRLVATCGVTCYKNKTMAERPMHLQTNFMFALPQRSRQLGSLAGDETRKVETVVFALIPEFEQVKVRDSDGHVYALTRKTRGIDLLALHEGQRIICTVTRKLPRVLSALALA